MASLGRPRTLDEAKDWMLEKLRGRAHPMNALPKKKGEELIASLQGLDGERWAANWRGAGDAVLEQAIAARAQNRPADAMALYSEASGYYFMGRFPCPNHPAKEQCARLERETYLAAADNWENPIEKVVLPFAGRENEGNSIVFYVRRPKGDGPFNAVIMWGGVDAWKEQMTQVSDALLARGIATIAMDNAGTGESPVKGVVDAERQFLPVIEWASSVAGFRGRPALLGRSFGGYWATKLAHLHADRIAAAVNWGGGAHFMFQRDWVEASRYPDSYLMELVETRKRMLGVDTDDEYVEGFARLSLVDQGLLDRPCAPLLLVNGKDDRQCPIADVHLLTEHGSPKSVRLFPGGHMGHTPKTLPTIIDWIELQLGRCTR